jgi:hypothetical protein
MPVVTAAFSRKMSSPQSRVMRQNQFLAGFLYVLLRNHKNSSLFSKVFLTKMTQDSLNLSHLTILRIIP